MITIQVDETVHGVNDVPLLVQSRIGVVEVAIVPALKKDEAEAVSTRAVTGGALDEWAVGSACYMCHTCTNFGVQGEEGRPCAKGLSDLIKRRSMARKNAQAARREGV